MPDTTTIAANRERLAQNLSTISSLTKEDYPNLYHLFHATSAQRTLEAVYGVMRSMEKALYISRAGTLFFAISERYLMRWWEKERNGAPLGSFRTWQGTLILLIHSGL